MLSVSEDIPMGELPLCIIVEIRLVLVTKPILSHTHTPRFLRSPSALSATSAPWRSPSPSRSSTATRWALTRNSSRSVLVASWAPSSALRCVRSVVVLLKLKCHAQNWGVVHCSRATPPPPISAHERLLLPLGREQRHGRIYARLQRHRGRAHRGDSAVPHWWVHVRVCVCVISVSALMRCTPRTAHSHHTQPPHSQACSTTCPLACWPPS